MDVFHQHLFVRYYAGIIWLAYTRSHLFYDDKSRNGKRYPFANMKTFCCHLRGEIQSKLLYKWISFAIQTFVIIEEMAFAILCFWSSNWVGFTKDSLELKVILSNLIGSDTKVQIKWPTVVSNSTCNLCVGVSEEILKWHSHSFSLMPYPCSHFHFDINFGERLYSKEKRPSSPLLFCI